MSIVKLIVEIIEPFHGKIFDPSCGSGGMFVQSAKFIQRQRKDPSKELSIYGQEKVEANTRICRMNLAVHGLSGDIREGNTYYEDLHKSVGKFDFVMANPPFNQDGVEKDRLKNDPRFPFGHPTSDSANYLWIQVFASSLNESGRAGFVMASSAPDARGTEQEIRRKLIESQAVDVMVSIGPNFFYTVTLPCTLWFFDKAKKKTGRKNEILFIDARNIFHQIDRAHRDFLPEQIEFLANIVRLFRGEAVENSAGSAKLMQQHFPKGQYVDCAGLCAVRTNKEISTQDWSLNPGRWVGVAKRAETSSEDFHDRLANLHGELTSLNKEAHALDKTIERQLSRLLEK